MMNLSFAERANYSFSMEFGRRPATHPSAYSFIFWAVEHLEFGFDDLCDAWDFQAGGGDGLA